jgi:hypothetical protein
MNRDMCMSQVRNMLYQSNGGLGCTQSTKQSFCATIRDKCATIRDKVANSSKTIFLGLAGLFAMVGSSKFNSEPARSLPFFAGALFFGSMGVTSKSRMSLGKRVMISLEQGMLLGFGAMAVAIDRGFIKQLNKAYA